MLFGRMRSQRQSAGVRCVAPLALVEEAISLAGRGLTIQDHKLPPACKGGCVRLRAHADWFISSLALEGVAKPF